MMMMMMRRVAALGLALSFISVQLTGQCHGQLQVGFYKGKCKFDVESIVRGVVEAKFITDKTIAAALLRLHFHDCFVHGCDASILLEGSNSEKTAQPNLSVRGYDIIDAAKAAVEFFCPGLVSCTDIIAMATRDSVLLAKGGRYNVQTGRRDGSVSSAQDVNLPSPSFNIPEAVAAFASKGLDVTDMVYLLGGHTVGVTHCSFFQDRLYNFQDTGKPDPTMDATLLSMLRQRSPQNSAGTNTTFLDQNPSSSFTVDNSFYQQILMHKGVLQVDQELALDPITKSIVATIANGKDFSYNFGRAMVKSKSSLEIKERSGDIVDQLTIHLTAVLIPTLKISMIILMLFAVSCFSFLLFMSFMYSFLFYVSIHIPFSTERFSVCIHYFLSTCKTFCRIIIMDYKS